VKREHLSLLLTVVMFALSRSLLAPIQVAEVPEASELVRFINPKAASVAPRVIERHADELPESSPSSSSLPVLLMVA
jgi:hypothetical protein